MFRRKPTLGFIVDELRVSYGNLFAVVKNLTKKDLLTVVCVQLIDDPKSLALTYEGKLLFEEVQVVHDKVLGNMFSAMRKNKKSDIKSDLTFILRHFSPEK